MKIDGQIPLDSCTVLNWDYDKAIEFITNPIVDDIFTAFYCRNFMTGYAQVRFPRKTTGIGNIPVPESIDTDNLHESYGLTKEEAEALRRYRNEICGT